MKNEKPKHFLIFKIIGFVSVIVAIIGFILSFLEFGNFENNLSIIGSFLGCFGLFIGVFCLLVGFRPEIEKLLTKSRKYIINDNKDDLTDITNTTADIVDDAITQTTRAVKKGLSPKESMFCKHCGAQIDIDSIFCSKCGKKQ